jgi:hypothetical protein
VIYITVSSTSLHSALHAVQQDKQNKEPIIDDNRDWCSLPSVDRLRFGSRFEITLTRVVHNVFRKAMYHMEAGIME